jgi:hypothetical protein
MEHMNTPPDQDPNKRPESVRPVTLTESEPTLRFPRPQGNRRLANWVSTSHPDIMHSTDLREAESLLSDSAYELINNTDSESQDGFHTESVCSSEDHPTDDAVSLTGTEPTQDGQDDAESDNSDSEENADDLEQDAPSEPDTRNGASGSETRDAMVEDMDDFEDLEATEPAPPKAIQSDIAEHQVQASIKYTEESLQTPSATVATGEKKQTLPEVLANLWARLPWGYRSILLYWAIGLVLFSGTGYFFLKPGPPDAMLVPVQPSPSTVYVSVTSPPTTSTVTKTVVVPEAKTSIAAPSMNTPLLSGHPTERVPEPKGSCTAEVYGRREILVKMPQGTKLSWLSKDTITIDVFRGRDLVKAKFSSVDEGILIEIPKADAHGVLNVSVMASRRPKINETFEIDFGTHIFDQAFEAGFDMFNEISTRVADAARLVREELDTTLGDVGDHIADLKKQASQAWQEAERLGGQSGAWMTSLQGQLWQKKRDLKLQAKSALLTAQIQANLFWLEMQGKKQQHDVYLRKAAKFMKQRKEELQRARGGRLGKKKAACKGFTLWAQH